MSKEVVDTIEYHEKLIYKKGLIDGIIMYSWMKDGVTLQEKH